MYDIYEISKFFIHKGLGSKYPVSNMKLQKLLYYAQGWYLASYNAPLFENDFYKWDFGPVCIDMYYIFKPFKGNPIPDTYSVFDLPDNIIPFLEKIWNTYGEFSAMQLSAISHTERPWLETPDSRIIPKCLIQEYYTQKLSGVNVENK